MSIVFLGLGSNLGNRRQNINKALSLMENLGIIVLTKSSIIETEPIGGPPQGKFLNAVIKIHTIYPPLKLLQKIKDIEKNMGRTKTELNGPRIIDIDILLYKDLKIDTENLTIPHPRMYERNFVMQPLREIDPRIIPKKV